MSLKQYDVVFSIGAACACSVALRRAKLQFASFPLDWIAGGTILERVSVVASHFRGWLEKEDFVYAGTNPVNGLGMFNNTRTRFSHLHDFADGPIEKSYEGVIEKYKRREAHLFSLCGKAKRILCVYVSRPSGKEIPDEDLHEARRQLAGTFPEATVDLVHFFNSPGVKPSERRLREPEEGIMQIGFDYHDPRRDVDVAAVASVLVEEGFRAKDFRTASERHAYELRQKMKKYGVTTRLGLLLARIKAQAERMVGIKPKTHRSELIGI